MAFKSEIIAKMKIGARIVATTLVVAMAAVIVTLLTHNGLALLQAFRFTVSVVMMTSHYHTE